MPQWTVKRGAEELLAAYREWGMTFEDFTGPRGLRIKRVRELQDAGRLDDELRWTPVAGRRRRCSSRARSSQGAAIIDVEPRGDERGFLARVFCEHEFAEHGLPTRFVQSSTIHSPLRHTLRGLHFQDGAARARSSSCAAPAAPSGW